MEHQKLNQMVEFLVFNRGMVCLVWFALAGLRIMHLACSLAKLASLIRTMLGLLDLRRLRLARSLASLVLTILGVLASLACLLGH